MSFFELLFSAAIEFPKAGGSSGDNWSRTSGNHARVEGCTILAESSAKRGKPPVEPLDGAGISDTKDDKGLYLRLFRFFAALFLFSPMV